MEFGARALGNRSIIADPRSENMQAKLNLNIKYRESFRPFARLLSQRDRMTILIWNSGVHICLYAGGKK